MGICDLIPGISGGTIAFIAGIYERLINAVKAFSPALLFSLFRVLISPKKENKQRLKENIKKLDLHFLMILFAGIITAILLGSRLIKYLLENYSSYTLVFFIGLILASSKIIFDDIKNHKLKNVSFGIVGLFIGIVLIFIVPKEMLLNYFYVFTGGFVAISALFLPGISGAFILVIMGMYEFMIDSLHHLFKNIDYLFVFFIGAVLGAFTISRVISFLFRKDKCKTLYFLLGLVIGATSIPLKKVYDTAHFNLPNIVLMLLIFCVSVFIVLAVSRFTNVKQKEVLYRKKVNVI
jgi:putative membrane protein